MGATSEQLEKLLNGIIPKKFSGVERIEVKEEDLDQHTYYIHVWVITDIGKILKSKNALQDFEDIRKIIKNLSRYVQLHVSQISFGSDDF